MLSPSPSPSPSPAPSPASNSSQLWLSPTSSSSVASSHMTRCGTHDAGPRLSKPLSEDMRVPHIPNLRLEPLDEDASFYGTAAAVKCVSYPSYQIGHSDGTISPKLGDAVDSGHPGSPDPTLLYDVNGDHTLYGYTAALFPEYFYTHMNKQSSVLGSSPSINYDTAQAIRSNAPQEHHLTNDVMSIAGAGVPPEKVPCIYGGCTKTFTRATDLDRHVLNVHNRVGHHCQVPGCNNNKGNGYCRPDKLKDHMWKTHGLVADLSYTKAMSLSFDMLE